MKIGKIITTFCFLGILISCNKKEPISAEEARKQAERQFENYLPKILKSHDAVLDVSQSHVGDFTGDGIDDVAIFFSLGPSNLGSAIVGQGLTLYKNTGDGIKVIAGYEPDNLFVFDTIQNGKIQVTLLKYAETDGRCCPSIRIKHTLKISGNKAY
ncbi:MAG: hypothetical protein QM710_12295 [Flavobacterium sp.]